MGIDLIRKNGKKCQLMTQMSAPELYEASNTEALLPEMVK